MGDKEFLERVLQSITSDNEEINHLERPARENFAIFQRYLEHALERWDFEYNSDNHVFHLTTPDGEYVSCWITQYGAEPTMQCRAMEELRILGNDYDAGNNFFLTFSAY